MLLIELNEFSSALLERATASGAFPAIAEVLAMQHARTVAVETEERHGLDPWVQWVSIHTGVPAEQHGIMHLGDAPLLRHKQLWECLAERGQRVGVWGCMNARYVELKGCDFFFPDPWTFTEPAWPAELNQFLALPRYYAKHYLDLKPWPLVKAGASTLWFLLKQLPTLLPHSVFMISSLFRAGFNSATLFALFDLVNALCFRACRRRHGSDVAVVFLNCMAHFQHHRWRPGERLHADELAFFRILDRTLAVLLDCASEGEPVLVANAFSQVNTAERGEVLYRQRDPESFFTLLGLPRGHRVEQLMTNDTQLIFASEADREAAEQLIASLHVIGQPAFQVDRKERDPLSLFCQFIVWDPIPPGSRLEGADGFAVDFYSCFQDVTVRTGSHVREGDLYYRNMHFPERLDNFGIFHGVLAHFSGSQGVTS